MMVMMPRLQAEERLVRIADGSFPHMEKHSRQRMVEELQRQTGAVRRSRSIDPAELAGMGMAVTHRKRPERALEKPGNPETPAAPGKAPGERQGGPDA